MHSTSIRSATVTKFGGASMRTPYTAVPYPTIPYPTYHWFRRPQPRRRPRRGRLISCRPAFTPVLAARNPRLEEARPSGNEHESQNVLAVHKARRRVAQKRRKNPYSPRFASTTTESQEETHYVLHPRRRSTITRNVLPPRPRPRIQGTPPRGLAALVRPRARPRPC